MCLVSRRRQFYRYSFPLGFAFCFFAATFQTIAADSLRWRQQEDKVSAEITASDLPHVLETIAEATGWHIFLEPGTKRTVSTKFKDRPPGEALRLLLGDLSYALLPQTNAPAKLFVFRTTMQEATQLIRPPDSKKASSRIPNELILTLKPGAKADELAKKLGAKILGRVPGMNAYRFSFDSAEAADAAREQLKSNGDVDGIDFNFQVQRPEPNEALALNSGVPEFNMKARATGGGPLIGLVDTPIQRQGGNMDAFLLPSISLAGDSQPSADNPTHGTAMMETILRGLSLGEKDSSAVRILPLDVYGNNPMTTTFDVANGIIQGMDKGVTIYNLSLGSSGDSDFLHNVIKNAAAQGILFFAAAGNEPTAAPSYPAAYPEVLAVTAGTRDGSIASYANFGGFVDLAAPGTGMVTFNGQTYVVTGTSASTAYVSGLAGAMMDGKKLTVDQIIAALQKALPVKR
jgi:subtilase family protein/fervidolysin-like protein